MNISQDSLQDIKVNIKIKLATLWTTFMFLYVYIDYFHLYMPGSIKGILEGKVFVFEISHLFLMVIMLLVSIPTLMIFLSLALTAQLNRWVNIIVATLLIPYVLFNLAGEAWIHMYFAAFMEVILLSLIIGFAWKWPIREKDFNK